MNKLTLFLLLFFTVFNLFPQGKTHEVPLKGNAYVTSSRQGGQITRWGLQNWSSENSVVETFVYFHQPQTVLIELKGKSDGDSKIELTVDGKKKMLKAKSGDFRISAGKFKIKKAGYVSLKLQGVTKTGCEFAEIESMFVHAGGELTFVNDFSEYWGRRGPSVHLKYNMPGDRKVEWFYNEITVPEGNDVIGSYYMANGFGQGYFGIQCNSEKERRVLFSVWSPFDTQDPKLIPDSLKIKMLRKGEGVTIGEFGNEGSGGQSFLRYDWNVALTYKFLTQVKPDGKGNTTYTSYFYAADENRWRLIASFLRPETDVHYTGAHSFLENFIPEQGYLTRKVLFSNQWFKTVDGEWIEADEATFTNDETARKRARLDYQGGYHSENNSFYLQNCGFFSDSTPYNAKFSREKKNVPPTIDFDALEEL